MLAPGEGIEPPTSPTLARQGALPLSYPGHVSFDGFKPSGDVLHVIAQRRANAQRRDDRRAGEMRRKNVAFISDEGARKPRRFCLVKGAG